MRLFELITFGRPYLDYVAKRVERRHLSGHGPLRQALLADRYGNAHLLEPVELELPSAFLSVADDAPSQAAWAREKGLPRTATEEDIVLAQIEDHRAEVLYNVSPLIYDSRFLKRLPGTVKRTICWRAAPVGNADLSGYDRCVCNFQGLLDQWARLGWKTAWFEPAHDPVASEYGRRSHRTVDVAFVGGYSRHHARRNLLLKRIAELGSRYDVRFHVSLGRAGRVVNSAWPLRRLLPHLALDGALLKVTQAPLYGRAMYELFGNARIVINAAIDMANEFRGNMRCWEALGCGAVMLSDEGIYPPGMLPGRDFETYRDTDDALGKIERILADYDAWRPMAGQGFATVESVYSKAAQWKAFVSLVDSI
jgi:hypothetical protein